jgi:hypothetical protein
MAKTLIFRNATTTGLASVVGTLAELWVDTTLKTVVVMDGVTSGGTTLARNADVQTLSSTTATNIATVSSNLSSVSSNLFSLTTTGAKAITNSGGWSVTPSSNTIYFNYNGTNVAKLDSSGNLTVKASITAFGTV